MRRLFATVRRRRLRQQIIVSMRLAVLSYSYHKYSNEIMPTKNPFAPLAVSSASSGNSSALKLQRRCYCSHGHTCNQHASGSGSESSRREASMTMRFESASSRHFEKPPAKNLYVTRQNPTMSPAKILCHV